MKQLIPILLCSCLAAAIGYHFGRSNALPNKPVAVVKAQPIEAQAAEATPATIPEPQPEAQPTQELQQTSLSPMQARANQAMQTLTDSTGRTIQAKVLSVGVNEVKVRRDDGLEVDIPLSMLSKEDVEFCEYLRKQTPQAAPKAKSADDIDWDAIFGS